MIVTAVNTYTREKERVELSLLQVIRLKLFGSVPVGERRYKNWRKPIKFYLFKCSRHGIYCLDYPHGYRGILWCPKCLDEMDEGLTPPRSNPPSQP